MMKDCKLEREFEKTLDKTLDLDHFMEMLNYPENSPQRYILNQMSPFEKNLAVEIALKYFESEEKKRAAQKISFLDALRCLFALPQKKHDIIKTPLINISNDDLQIIYKKVLIKLDLNYEKMYTLDRKAKIDLIQTYRVQCKESQKAKKINIVSDIITDMKHETLNMELNLEMCRLFDKTNVPEENREQFYQMDVESKKTFVKLYPQTPRLIKDIKLMPKVNRSCTKFQTKEIQQGSRSQSFCNIKFEEFQEMYSRYKKSQEKLSHRLTQ